MDFYLDLHRDVPPKMPKPGDVLPVIDEDGNVITHMIVTAERIGPDGETVLDLLSDVVAE